MESTGQHESRSCGGKCPTCGRRGDSPSDPGVALSGGRLALAAAAAFLLPLGLAIAGAAVAGAAEVAKVAGAAAGLIAGAAAAAAICRRLRRPRREVP